MKKRWIEKRSGRSGAGFTLIEIMLVIVIIGIIVAVAVPNVAEYLGEGRSTKAKADMSQLSMAIDMYEMKEGTYPNNLDEVSKYVKGNMIPVDPWKKAYQYTKTSDGKYELYCTGKSGSERITMFDQ